MKNTIAIKEKRSTINRFKSWYIESLINTGKTEQFEEKVEDYISKEKKLVYIVGSLATIVLVFCPIDGPVGEISSLLATPMLATLVDIKCNMLRKVIIGSKRKIEAEFIHKNGSSNKINIPDFSLEDLIIDAKDTKRACDNYKTYAKNIRGKNGKTNR